MTKTERYCHLYDTYQTLFALHRLGGWDGNMDTSPPSIIEGHTRMNDAFGDMYEEIMGRRRPNYVQLAQDLAKESLG